MKKVNLSIALGLVSVVTGTNAATVKVKEPTGPAVQLSSESVKPLIESKSGTLLAQGGNGGAGGKSPAGGNGGAGGKSPAGGNGGSSQPKK